MSIESNTTSGYFVSRVAGTHFAVLAERVLTVIEPTLPTPVPMAPKHIIGLVAMAQRALPLLSLPLFLQLAEREGAESGELPRTLVIKNDEYEVAIPVEKAQGVVNLSEAEIEPPTLLSGGNLKEFLAGEFKLGDEIVGLIDIDKLLESASV